MWSARLMRCDLCQSQPFDFTQDLQRDRPTFCILRSRPFDFTQDLQQDRATFCAVGVGYYDFTHALIFIFGCA